MICSSLFTTASLLLPLYCCLRGGSSNKSSCRILYIVYIEKGSYSRGVICLYIYIIWAYIYEARWSERRISDSLPQHLYAASLPQHLYCLALMCPQVNGLKRGFSERRIAAFNFFVRDMVGKIRQDDPSIEHQVRQTYTYILALYFFFGGGGNAWQNPTRRPLHWAPGKTDICMYISAVFFFLGGGDAWQSPTGGPLYWAPGKTEICIYI